MSIRLSICVAALLSAVFAAGPDFAFGSTSRLEAMAARQDLCDMVCIAMSDGQVSDWERSEILNDAKQILTAEEYASFKRAFERIAPPPKKTASKRSARMAGKKPAAKPRATAKTQAEPSPGPVIPAGAVLPDRMASGGRVR